MGERHHPPAQQKSTYDLSWPSPYVISNCREKISTSVIIFKRTLKFNWTIYIFVQKLRGLKFHLRQVISWNVNPVFSISLYQEVLGNQKNNLKDEIRFVISKNCGKIIYAMFYGCICCYPHLCVHKIFICYSQDHQNQGDCSVAGVPVMAMKPI